MAPESAGNRRVSVPYHGCIICHDGQWFVQEPTYTVNPFSTNDAYMHHDAYMHRECYITFVSWAIDSRTSLATSAPDCPECRICYSHTCSHCMGRTSTSSYPYLMLVYRKYHAEQDRTSPHTPQLLQLQSDRWGQMSRGRSEIWIIDAM